MVAFALNETLINLPVELLDSKGDDEFVHEGSGLAQANARSCVLRLQNRGRI